MSLDDRDYEQEHNLRESENELVGAECYIDAQEQELTQLRQQVVGLKHSLDFEKRRNERMMDGLRLINRTAVTAAQVAGSEYTDWDGTLRVIRDVVDRAEGNWRGLKAEIRERKEVERQRDALRAAIEPFANNLDWYDAGKGYVMRRSDRMITREQTDTLIVTYVQTAPKGDSK